MTDTRQETGRNPAETLSDRELAEDIHAMLRRICGHLDALGIKGNLSYMDLAGIARKMRKGNGGKD